MTPPGSSPLPSGSTAADQTPVSLTDAAPVVLDTNIVLDLLVFHDPRSAELRTALEIGRLRWLATAPMRDELERVLGYPQLTPRLSHHGLSAETVLTAFDAWVSLCPVAPKAPYTCKDPDDQKFIDLAAAHRAALLSKDRAVLVMRKRLLQLGVALNPGADGKGL